MAKILVVDDEEGIVLLLNGFLESLGHSIENAHTGREALEKVKTHDPDILLLDYKLPDMDGIKVLKEIRSRNKKVKVIMITGNIESDFARMTESLGVHGLMRKPFDLTRLEQMLQEIIRPQEG